MLTTPHNFVQKTAFKAKSMVLKDENDKICTEKNFPPNPTFHYTQAKKERARFKTFLQLLNMLLDNF